MYGRPSRVGVTMRPDYLSQSYLAPGGDFSTGSSAPPMDMSMTDMSMMLPAGDMMTVSAMPPEGEKDNNFARLMGVSLLVLVVALAMRKK